MICPTFDEMLDAPTQDTYILQEGEIDPRILNLSYSSLLSLHSCPRKLQLDRLGSVKESVESISETITFSYGQIVGLGIQMSLSLIHI